MLVVLPLLCVIAYCDYRCCGGRSIVAYFLSLTVTDIMLGGYGCCLTWGLILLTNCVSCRCCTSKRADSFFHS